MNIAQMKVAIRPMSTAQAVDLGMKIARYWFVPLWKIWVGMALPIFLIFAIGLTVLESQTGITIGWLGGLIFWWLKPLYEKPMLIWLSQALFDDAPDATDSIKKGWQESKSYSGKLLLRYRLSPQRQLIIPVALLEQPNKAQFKDRLSVLSRGQGGGLTWHTLVLVHIETAIAIAMVIVLWQLIPTGFMSADTIFSFIEQAPFWFSVISSLFYFIAVSIVAPFFIAGGFAVYLTKRCLLEGWDVELVFKQLRYRYEQSRANPLTALKENKLTALKDNKLTALKDSKLSSGKSGIHSNQRPMQSSNTNNTNNHANTPSSNDFLNQQGGR